MNSSEAVQRNFVTDNVEEHIDRIKLAVDHIIAKYSKEEPQDTTEYKKMTELSTLDAHVYEDLKTRTQRNSAGKPDGQPEK